MFSSTHIDADVVICSSSGWAHGIKTDGRKIVYCHTPARWLYQSERYSQRLRPSERALLTVVKPVLLRWDRTAAQSADVYIANSTVVRDRIEAIYGITADVLPPPPVLDPLGESAAVPDAEPGFFLCVARLLPYKNVDAVLDAFASLPDDSLIVVGAGPERERLQATAPRNVRFLGLVDDRELRWLYTNCAALVAASYEDYGLTPLEAATFGRPAACLRWGGFLDTTREDVTAVFFSSPTGPAITDAIVRLKGMTWSEKAIRDNAHGFRTEVFCDRLRGYTTSLD
jgi:glycosyltransferase involved in cell wall biosynthesis